jgi:hypothetical protein
MSIGCASAPYDPASPFADPAPQDNQSRTDQPSTDQSRRDERTDSPRRDDDRFGPEKGDWELLLGGSGSNDKDFDNGGFNFAGSIGYFLTDGLELALRQNVSWSDFGSATYIGTTRAALDYHFDLGRWAPLIGANLGYVYGDNIDETFEAAPEVGLKWFAKEETFIYGLVEYQFFFKNTDAADDGFKHGSFVYTLGIGFLF